MLPGGTTACGDRCAASIADGHRNCGECGSDYRLDCCAEMRLLPHYRARAEHRPALARWEGDEARFVDVASAGDGRRRARGEGGGDGGDGGRAAARRRRRRGTGPPKGRRFAPPRRARRRRARRTR